VVPVFALANAGVDLGDGALADAATSRVALAVAVALVAGKLAGIGAASWVAIRTGVGRAPEGVEFHHLLGAGALGGIGFTVSLFVTGLAFEAGALRNLAKIGILAGSLAAALLGVAFLTLIGRRQS
jgi:Na+/H+ antiporter NhaA